MSEGKTLILFDGRCGLCDRVVRFVLRRDRHDRFVFAPLQSPLGIELMSRHGLDARRLDTFGAVQDHGGRAERVRVKGRAGIFLLRRLGGIWSLAAVLGVLPTRLLDGVYDRVARNRFAWFGKLEACRVPTPAERAKFLTLEMEPEAETTRAAT